MRRLAMRMQRFIGTQIGAAADARIQIGQVVCQLYMRRCAADPELLKGEIFTFGQRLEGVVCITADHR